MSKRVFLKSASVLAIGLALAGWAQAQSFPNKPIRLVCPFPPAGAGLAPAGVGVAVRVRDEDPDRGLLRLGARGRGPGR